MPESEPKPKLIELIGPGAGQGWKAVLRNGKAAVVHEIPVPQAEATAAVPRLQRLYEHRHPALSPVLAWGTDQNGVWVAVEPNEGTPLSSILTRGPMTPGAAAALGAAVLSGVAALHEMGIAMGGFGATAVRVTSNGEVRIAGHPAAAVRGAPSQSDLRADVRSSGMAVCAAFGVDPAGSPAPPSIPPGLVVTMRSMASGAMGPSADRAQGALREMAAPLLAPDRQMAAQSELATRAGGREVPAITPFLPADAAPPRPQPFTPAAGVPAAPPAQSTQPPPAPFLSSPRPEDRPSRGSVYEAPDRPVQTYPSIPAASFPPPAPAAPAPEPPLPIAPAASAAVDTPPSAPAVPTWAEASSAPVKPPESEPSPASTNPPAAQPAAPAPRAPLPWEEPAKEPEPLPPSPARSWEPAAPAAASPFATSPPAAEPAAPSSPPAPTPSPPSPPAQSWTPVEPPVWKPGEVVPAEPLGTGYAIDIPNLNRTSEAAPTPAPAPARVPTPAPAPRRSTVPRPGTGGIGSGERPRWLVPAAAAIIVLLLLGIFGVVVLPRLGGGGKVASGTTPSAHASGSPKGSPSSSPSGHEPQTVPTYAPASAPPITKVQFCTVATPCKIAVGIADETATNCDLATSCSVEVALYFSSGQRVPVHYDLKFFDRCTGQETDLPGPPDFTPPGYAVVIPRDKWVVNLPAGAKSAALVAVSSKPSVAASAPLLLGADTC